LEAVYEHWRPKAGKQMEDQFSDGTLRLIAFLWSILEGESLLLMEEPELSLHAAIVTKLPGLMWRTQTKKKRQILISTHSGDLLSDKGIGGEEVLLLIPDVEGTKIQLASSIKDIRELLSAGFSVAEVALPKTEPNYIKQLSLFND
jgi:predicted ATPase